MTTTLKQYRAAKAENPPDVLLVFRVGDFYESFDADAETIAKVLGLALTTSSKGDGSVRMCGFPHHQLEAYLSKLLKAKHRVAIGKQVSDLRKE